MLGQLTPEDSLKRLFNGRSLSYTFYNRGPEKIREVLCQRAGRVPMLGLSRKMLDNGVVPGHAYAILGFDQERNAVRLANPWRAGEWLGQFDGENDGLFEMPLLDFYASFAQITHLLDKSA